MIHPCCGKPGGGFAGFCGMFPDHGGDCGEWVYDVEVLRTRVAELEEEVEFHSRLRQENLQVYINEVDRLMKERANNVKDEANRIDTPHSDEAQVATPREAQAEWAPDWPELDMCSACDLRPRVVAFRATPNADWFAFCAPCMDRMNALRTDKATWDPVGGRPINPDPVAAIAGICDVSSSDGSK